MADDGKKYIFPTAPLALPLITLRLSSSLFYSGVWNFIVRSECEEISVLGDVGKNYEFIHFFSLIQNW